MLPILNRFRIRLAVLFGALILAAGLSIALYINQAATARMTADSGEALQVLSRNIALAISTNLVEREREVALLSRMPSFVREDLGGPLIRQVLEQRRQAYRSYAWVGIADPEGRVLAAAGNLLEGENVARRPWFVHGREGLHIGDVHEAALLAKKLQVEDPSEPLRFVDFAAPIRDAEGRLRGVLATHVHWSWVEQMIAASLPDNAREEGIEVFVVGPRGQVLYPFARIAQTDVPTVPDNGSAYRITDWGGEGRFLTAYAAVRPDTNTQLGWRVVIRQPVASALAPVGEMHRNALILGGLLAGLTIFLVYRLAARFSQPVEHLAETARRIRQGDETTPFAEPGGIREIRELADALRGMTSMLIQRRQELEAANATLEEKVRERTAELERLVRHDALTGLHNRFAANERLRQEFLRTKRDGPAYAVLLMDIDHFKRVNDSFGHETGDRVLRQVADILGRSARVTDFVSRFGGEEFLVLLPATGRDGAFVVAEKIRSAVAASDFPEVGRVTLSIGLATSDPAAANEDAAVRIADAALYRAKAEGRNRVVA